MPETNRGDIIYNTPKDNIERGEDSLHTFDLVLDGELIGRAEVEYFSKPFPLYQVSTLYIENEYQGEGRAGDVMGQIEAFLEKKKKAGVVIDGILDCSPASGMYERRGWQQVPGEICVYAYNIPKSAKIEDLKAYSERQTFVTEREGWKKKHGVKN